MGAGVGLQPQRLDFFISKAELSHLVVGGMVWQPLQGMYALNASPICLATTPHIHHV